MSKRIKFFWGHLTISLAIALFFIAVVFFIWYPAPLAKAVGVTQIFLMLIVIDVVIGPFLTLLVYKEGKKTLKMDLAVIILIQTFALGYGVFNIAQGRPAWIVYDNAGRFDLVRNNEIETGDIAQAQKAYQKASWLKPQIVALKKEKSIETQNKQLFEDLSKGIIPTMHPERYTKLSDAKIELLQNSEKIDVLTNFNTKEAVDKTLNQYPTADAWLPLKSTNVDMVVLINKEKGEVVKIVDLRPWK
ncbi:TfpX/TfpZ family type IV pilin accessory protein [Acinetobacter bereziniae]|uniref:TfpX/TfpZ family type IV pilin accessory protein n=1 Tax=Acinetobacter bereziniae TaxID=106648 RepID=UPI00124FF4A4|nr:TfpX/TfpZ family type IV pilin accessory protein [Acinetobacter bereziniae]MBJ9901249.1 type IV pilin accessory protein [Acinetobacter bereziniae]MCU4319241.1 type IV pilin accessory protein [Acinetobacter bereziniae]MCU4597339.1 type IV pilin accessory protein [Acinetobacter bereziniae]